MDAAERLFGEHGYSGVTMEDIAREAGVTRPIVYRHFATREGAFLACVERASSAYHAELVRRLDPTARATDQLRAGGEAFFRMVEEQPGRFRLLFGSDAVLPSDYAQQLAEVRFGTIRLIHLQLRSAAPQAPEPELEAAAHAISGAGERLGHWWGTRPDLPRERLVELFVTLCWQGIAPFVVPTGEDGAPGRDGEDASSTRTGVQAGDAGPSSTASP